MNEKATKPLLVPLLALLSLTLVFIPVARLLDSMFPGPHMGFQLLGIWFVWVLPGAIVLGVATVAAGRKDLLKLRPPQFALVAVLVYTVFFLIALLKYRRWF